MTILKNERAPPHCHRVAHWVARVWKLEFGEALRPILYFIVLDPPEDVFCFHRRLAHGHVLGTRRAQSSWTGIDPRARSRPYSVSVPRRRVAGRTAPVLVDPEHQSRRARGPYLN